MKKYELNFKGIRKAGKKRVKYGNPQNFGDVNILTIT